MDVALDILPGQQGTPAYITPTTPTLTGGSGLSQRPVANAAARATPAPPAPTTRAFYRLMGRQSPPMRIGHVEVLAERAVGDDFDGTFPGIVASVEGDLVRVVYALGVQKDTLVESVLHVAQVRQLIGRPPT